MKTACPVCEAQYTIPDEKVAGKVVKIRCARCQGVVVADGTKIVASAPRPAVPTSPTPAPVAASTPAPPSPSPAPPRTVTKPPPPPSPTAKTIVTTAPPPPPPQTARAQPKPRPAPPPIPSHVAVPPPRPAVAPRTAQTPTPTRRKRSTRPPRSTQSKLPGYRARGWAAVHEHAAQTSGAGTVPYPPRVARDASKVDFEVPIEFNFESHYDVLGLSRSATAEEIKRAAFDMHALCDRRARMKDETATQKLQKVNEAQEILSKPEKRARYDRDPEAIFLTIQDPFPYERLAWNDGLELIKALAMTPADRDPLRELEGSIDQGARPNAILDAMLK
jgi:predicted Zn finger-like uncharacterized protein